jgi:chitodextrinase
VPADAVGVRILRSTVGFASSASDLVNQVLATDANGITTFTDTGLTDGTTYFFTLFARDSAGNFSTPAVITAVPGIDTVAPAALAIVATPGDSLTALTFSLPADATAARILRSTTAFATAPASSADQTLVFDGTGPTVTDLGLTNDVMYFYTAYARDAAGNYSPPAMVTSTPTAVTGTGGGAGGGVGGGGGTDTIAPYPVVVSVVAGNARVTLSWSEDPDVTGVRIMRSTITYASSINDTIGQTHVYDGNALGYTDTDVANDTTYYYTVFAKDAAGNISAASMAEATPYGAVAPDPVPVPDPKDDGDDGDHRPCGCSSADSMMALSGIFALAAFNRRRRKQQ